jgi:hypothetical protein
MTKKDKSDTNSDQKRTYNSDVTNEDLKALGKKGLSMDTHDDKVLKERKKPIDFAGNDLDIPGREKTSHNKNKLKDEENTLYGQGGDRKEHLEDRKDSDSPRK